jgi:hypothetical protein
VLQRLLLLPLLSPLLAVLLVAAVNPRPWVSVRVLTWSSPTWPLGGWIATAAALGAAISSAGAALALQGQAPGVIAERQVRRRPNEPQRRAEASEAAWSGWSEPEPARPAPNERSWAGPSRNPQDPAPTVSVPFRVIRKGAANSTPAAAAKPTTSAPAAAPATSATSNADWDAPISDDW